MNTLSLKKEKLLQIWRKFLLINRNRVSPASGEAEASTSKVPNQKFRVLKNLPVLCKLSVFCGESSVLLPKLRFFRNIVLRPRRHLEIYENFLRKRS